MRSPNIVINSDVFKWLRESSGWSREDVSRRLNVSVNQVSKWESGEKHPTINELKELAKAYKRPLAAFFLPRPEKEPPLPHDFRRLPGGSRPFSKKTLFAIRRAGNLQAISGELMENLNQEKGPDISKAGLRESPEKIASEEREKIGLSIEMQKSWKSYYEAFNSLRELIERKNILVFQFPAELDELRGFTLMDSEPFVIFVNSSDIIQARIFTLLHEYGHVLLNEPSLCIPKEDTVNEKDHDGKVESWCNRFAGAFLLPKESVEEAYQKHGVRNLKRIAGQHKTSLLAVLTRLVTLHIITQKTYRAEVNKLLSGELAARESETGGKKGGKGESSAIKALRERGEPFVSLVLENSQQGLITQSRALDYLDVKMKNMKELTS
ncbi:MAG: XRE family transcriptional regulator [Clostridia bacterium]|nr:XRE family transcriptional regulator [Clostridia bacterium]